MDDADMSTIDDQYVDNDMWINELGDKLNSKNS